MLPGEKCTNYCQCQEQRHRCILLDNIRPTVFAVEITLSCKLSLSLSVKDTSQLVSSPSLPFFTILLATSSLYFFCLALVTFPLCFPRQLSLTSCRLQLHSFTVQTSRFTQMSNTWKLNLPGSQLEVEVCFLIFFFVAPWPLAKHHCCSLYLQLKTNTCVIGVRVLKVHLLLPINQDLEFSVGMASNFRIIFTHAGIHGIRNIYCTE